MYFKCRFEWLAALAIFLTIVGCAKTNVKPTYEVASTGLPRPEHVLIYNFDVDPSLVQLNSSVIAKALRNKDNQQADKMGVGREVADALATELTENITALGLHPLRATQNMPVTPGSVVITGKFSKIDEGNPIRRNVIGLGMGQASLDCEAQLMVPATHGYQKLIAFDAHADSGSMPGAAVMGPAGAAAGAATAAVVATNVAVGGIKSYKSASAQQAKKLADKITEQLATYFAQQGWISPSAGQK